MKHTRLILATAGIAVFCVVALAFYFGRPGQAPSPRPTSTSTAAPVPPLTSNASWNGLTIRGNGPVPRCSDDAAVHNLVGALEKMVPGRSLALANIQVRGHFQVGDLAEWDCDADVQAGVTPRRIRYQIAQISEGSDLWQIVVSDAPKAAP